MRFSHIYRSPNARTLRQFAGLWIFFFGAMAVWKLAMQAPLSLVYVLAGLALVKGTVSDPTLGSGSSANGAYAVIGDTVFVKVGFVIWILGSGWRIRGLLRSCTSWNDSLRFSEIRRIVLRL